MFLVSVKYPLELQNFFSVLFPLLTFDALPVDPLYDKIFKFSNITTDQALTDQFDSNGYSSIFIIKNVGSLFLIAVLQVTLSIILWLIRECKLFRCSVVIQGKLDSVADGTLWNGLLTFLSTNYLLFTIVCFIESDDLRFGSEYSATEKFCSFLAVLGMAGLVSFPIIIYCFYRVKTNYIDTAINKNQKILDCVTMNVKSTEETVKLEEKLQFDHYLFTQLLKSKQHQSFMKTYGALIEGLNIHRIGRKVTLITPIIDILMKLLIAVSVTRLVRWPTFTIFVFNFAILFQAQFQFYFTPQEDRFERFRACFNAVSFLVLNYHLFLFTKFTDQSTHPFIANSVIVLMCFCVAMNVLLTAPIQAFRFLMQMKQRFMRRK